MDYCLNLNSSTKLKQSTRTTKQNRHFYFTNPTALSFKKNVISQKIVLFYSANFGGFSSLAYLLSQSHCVYKSKSQKPLNISFTPKQLP